MSSGVAIRYDNCAEWSWQSGTGDDYRPQWGGAVRRHSGFYFHSMEVFGLAPSFPDQLVPRGASGIIIGSNDIAFLTAEDDDDARPRVEQEHRLHFRVELLQQSPEVEE